MQGAKREYRYAFAYRIPRTYDHLNGQVGALRPSKGIRIGESVVKYSRTNPVPHKRVFETKALSPRNTYNNRGNDISGQIQMRRKYIPTTHWEPGGGSLPLKNTPYCKMLY